MAMALAHLRREERIGLGVAVALHLGIVAAFLIQSRHRAEIEPVQRMTVSLVDNVAMSASAPQPVPESRAAIAPELSSETNPAPQAEQKPKPESKPQEKPAPQPRPQPPVAKEKPKPAPPQPKKKQGGSLLGDNFLAGLGSSTKTDETRAAASELGPGVSASLVQAIARQIKPHWTPPDGPDIDKVTSYVRFQLNKDGSLAGRPQLVRQTGITPINRAQAGRHGELAIRAVQLAAPFDLPAKYYDVWKTVTFSFDYRLAQ
ncbi:MAG: energy transducer TonB [Sphingomonadaceae bacterium]